MVSFAPEIDEFGSPDRANSRVRDAPRMNPFCGVVGQMSIRRLSMRPSTLGSTRLNPGHRFTLGGHPVARKLRRG